MWLCNRRVRVGRAAAISALALALAACGFHLRGSGPGAVLPPSLATVRVVMAGPAMNTPLTREVREALAQAGARVVEEGEAPALTLLDERIYSRVAAVSTATAKVTEYIVQYGVSFRLDGPRPVAAQTIQLQRHYSFDPTQVLAKEQEERDLVQEMRRDAAQQIVRRLARARATSER